MVSAGICLRDAESRFHPAIGGMKSMRVWEYESMGIKPAIPEEEKT